MFGGKPLQGHSIPPVYGAIEPTAVFVPLQSILGSPDAFKAATTEVFGPLQARIPRKTCSRAQLLAALKTCLGAGAGAWSCNLHVQALL